MAEPENLLIVGGSQGLGLEVAKHYAGKGGNVVITSRDQAKAESVARSIGPNVRGIALDLTKPNEIAGNLRSIEKIDGLVIAAIERDENTAKNFDIERAIGLATLKLVGYTETIHALCDRFPEDGAGIVLFGGLAKDRPYPGSTTVTMVNGAISTLVHTLACEVAPNRVNAIHPGIVTDSPYWAGKEAALQRVRDRTPGGRTVKMADIVGAVAFLLENEGVNGENLNVDRGWMSM